MGKITINELKVLFDAADKLPVHPKYEDFPVYAKTDVIDEDQTVKWNRQEIKRRMQAREEESERLKAIRKAAIQDAYGQALEYIVQETGMEYEKATVLWDFVVSTYQNHHTDLWVYFENQIRLYNKLKYGERR